MSEVILKGAIMMIENQEQQSDIFIKQQMLVSHCELPAYILNKERNVTCICLCISAQVQSFQISPGISVL